jgi:hypothetical protein
VADLSLDLNYSNNFFHVNVPLNSRRSRYRFRNNEEISLITCLANTKLNIIYLNLCRTRDTRVRWKCMWNQQMCEYEKICKHFLHRKCTSCKVLCNLHFSKIFWFSKLFPPYAKYRTVRYTTAEINSYSMEYSPF